jgi:hypothetical protein
VRVVRVTMARPLGVPGLGAGALDTWSAARRADGKAAS